MRPNERAAGHTQLRTPLFPLFAPVEIFRLERFLIQNSKTQEWSYEDGRCQQFQAVRNAVS